MVLLIFYVSTTLIYFKTFSIILQSVPNISLTKLEVMVIFISHVVLMVHKCYTCSIAPLEKKSISHEFHGNFSVVW